MTNQKEEGKTLTTVYHFPNGVYMAFDQDGQQMPDYQGLDALEKIRRDYPFVTIQEQTWR